MAFYPNMVWVASVLVIKKLGCDFEKHWEPVLHCSAFEIFSHFKHTWGMYMGYVCCCRKRKSIDIGQKSLKKQRTLSSVDAKGRHLNSENTIVQDDDETQDVKPQLVVKFPARSKKRGDVIVIDDSDSDAAAAAVDGEDDAHGTINCLPETPENNHPKIKEEQQSKNDKHSASGNGSVDRHPNDDLLNRSRRSTRNVRSVRTQTMIPNDPNTANEQLNSLRSNVVKLLQVILPNLDAFANIALENVDNALIEVLRVNGVTGSDDQVTTSVDQVTRSESTSE